MTTIHTPQTAPVITALPAWMLVELDRTYARPFGPVRTVTGAREGRGASTALDLLASATPKRGPKGLTAATKKPADAAQVFDAGVRALLLAMRAHRKHHNETIESSLSLGEVAAAAAGLLAEHALPSALCFELAGQLLLEPQTTEVALTLIAPGTVLATVGAWIDHMAHVRETDPARVLAMLQRCAVSPTARSAS